MPSSFGYWVRRRRKALDLTQAELARRLGCAEVTIQKIEADTRRPSSQIAELLAEHLRIPSGERSTFLQRARGELTVDQLPASTPDGRHLVHAPAMASTDAPAAALPSGTVTFLFTDIAGSTQLWEQHSQAMPAVLARHDALLRQAIEAHGGMVFKTSGDGVHAVFVTASDALAAALVTQRALHIEPWGATSPLLVRMALHTGAAQQIHRDYSGPPLNRLARILAAGSGGQILLSLATAELVRDHLPSGVTLHDLGTHSLKDLSHPEQIFQLISPDLMADFSPPRPSEAGSPQPAAGALPLLTTKLAIPPARANLVPRPRLIARLVAGSAGPLTLIAAPAGFGKTTLLTSWLAAGTEDQGLRTELVALSRSPQSSAPNTRVAWLSLDAGDNDPTSFLRYLIAALRRVVPAPVGALALALLEAPQPPPLPPLLTTLLNDLAAVSQPVLLVLDDYHLIATPALHDALTFVLERLPSTLHLVIASRDDPPLPLARLRARGQLTELRTADLRFTPDETTAFLRDVMGFNLAANEVAALDARTEGWIAGLQLAALAMRDRTDRAGFIAAFSGSNRFIIDYLASEVLDRLPAHLRSFVLQTAILERMCGPLCDAVLGMTKDERPMTKDESDRFFVLRPSSFVGDSYSQLILEQLERANLFLISLDQERRWYRYHHLFAEVLCERLALGVPATEVAALHRRASAWYEQHGLVAEAVQHALTAADRDRAAHLIEHHGLRVIVDGQVQTMLGWLRVLPDALLRARPMLCILHAFALQFTNQLEAAEARVQDAERCIQPDTPPDQVHRIQGYAAAIRANSARFRGDVASDVAFGQKALAYHSDDLPGLGDLASAVAFGQQVLRWLPETEVIPRMAGMLSAARAFRVSGDVTEANERLAVAVVARLRASGNRSGLLLAAVTNLARLRVLQGRLRGAAATYREMAQIAPRPDELQRLHGGPAYYVGMGELLREWNDLDAADRHLAQAMELLPGTLAVDAEDVALGYLALARLQQAREDHAAARVTLDAFINLARRRGFVSHLVARGAAVQAQLALSQGDLAAAVAWADASGAQRVPGAADDLSFSREAEYLILARVLIAQGRGDRTSQRLPEALRLLDRLFAEATAGGRMGSALEILILRALTLHAQGDGTDALATLEHALSLGETEGYIRVFVDEGAPMAELLRAADARGVAPGYVAKLLAAFPERLVVRGLGLADVVQASSLKPQASSLVEPLTVRELEVLRLIAAGRSNAQIAQALVVAVSTVKAHVNHLFGKLAVTSRTQAIARAQELDLL